MVGWLIYFHLYGNPDPGSKNVADPTDPDPKHCFEQTIIVFKEITIQFLIRGMSIVQYLTAYS